MTQLLRDAFAVTLIVCLPLLIAVLLIGVVTALLRGATGLSDRSLSVVPRLLATMLALGLFAPFIGARLLQFMRQVLEALPGVGRS
jgi:flagellar biosynthetic protein FliQ